MTKQLNFNRTRTMLLVLIFGLTTLSLSSQIINKNKSTINLSNAPLYGKIDTNTVDPFSRLPKKMQKELPNKLWQLSLDTAGIYTAFKTDSKQFTLQWKVKKTLAMPHMSSSGVSGFDCYIFRNDRWEFLQNSKPSVKSGMMKINNPLNNSQVNEFLILFPLYNQPQKAIIKKQIGSHFEFTNPFEEKTKLPYLIYGTSITQGACSSRPGNSYVNRLRLKLNEPVINMGFSGSAYIEKEMVDYLASFPATLFIADCLWNMGGFTDEELTKRARYLVETYRKHQPNTPILLVGQSKFDNQTPTAREKVLYTLFEKLVTEGITELYFLEGSSLIGEDTEATVDGVHPNDLGMQRMTEAYYNKIIEITGRN